MPHVDGSAVIGSIHPPVDDHSVGAIAKKGELGNVLRAKDILLTLRLLFFALLLRREIMKMK
jgi:hypothetical protein